MKKLLLTIVTISFSSGYLSAQQDLQLDTLIFQTKTDSSIHSYYSMVPWSQAKKDTIHFSGMVTNNSTMNNTNIVLSNHINTPLSFDTVYSSPLNLTPNQTDTIVINQPFTFTDSIGSYSWFFSATSDSIDTILTNNAKDTFKIEVTDTTFARDRNASGNYNYGSNGYEIAVMYEVLDTVKATSVSIDFGSNTLNFETFSLYIYDENFQLIGSREFMDTYNQNGFRAYSITETVLIPGKYFVSCKSFFGDLFFKKSDFIADSGIAFIDTTNSGNWQPIPFIIPIRLNVSRNLKICNLKMQIEYYGALGCDSARVIPYNGVPPYTFIWENGDTTNYITNLEPYTPYTVQVTDSVGCISNFVVLCFLGSVNEQTISQFSIYPNPARETINIEFSLSANYREYSFEIYDILGKRVLSKTLAANRSSVNVSHLEPGVYICKFGESKVRVIIE